MVVTTAKLLQRQGFHGTGLNQILAEADAPKGSMYFHFPGGKEQLATEAITASGEYVDRALAAHAMTHAEGDAAGALDAYLAGLVDLLRRSDFQNGCPIATVALEVGATSPEIGDACAGAFERSIERIAGWIEAGGVGAVAASERAFLVYASIEGALLFAKAQRSVEPIERLRSLLPRLIGEPTG